MSSFGKTLKRIRETKGLTQREVSRRINMDHARFSRLENDRTGFNPTRETIEKIAQALDCRKEEQGELLAAAGRLDQEIESLAHLLNTRPAVARLLQIIIHLPQNQIGELLIQVEKNFSVALEETTKNVGMKIMGRETVTRRKTRDRSQS